MAVVTSRDDFKKLIDLRLMEAKLLFDHQDWDGAYYLSGYAIEFALKIKIIADFVQSDSFPDKNFLSSFYSHELVKLRVAAGLDKQMDADITVNLEWKTVKDWTEQSRYEFDKTEATATALLVAIESKVLPWIKGHW